MNTINTETGEVTTLEIQSAEINELAKALAKAQADISSAKMDGLNPHFGKNYATLDSIWNAARKPLTDNGLSVAQTLMPDNTMVTILLHESGQWLRSYLKMNPVKNDPQGIGSALTYARRYSLAAIVGIAQADDDGETASQPAKTAPRKATPPAAPPKETNGGASKAAADPMTRFWLEVKASSLTREQGQAILTQANNDPSRAVDVLLGMAQE